MTKLSLASDKTSFIHKPASRTIGTILINGGQPDRCRQSRLLGAVHILRQPPEGGEGVRQMLTIADEGGVEPEKNLSKWVKK